MKRATELKGLSNDHHHALVWAKKIQRTLLDQRQPLTTLWQQTQQFYREQLHPHFKIEEQHIAAALGECPLTAQLHQEHQELYQLIHQQPPSRDTLHDFAALLISHIRFEERELFEYAQQTLTEKQLQALQQAQTPQTTGTP